MLSILTPAEVAVFEKKPHLFYAACRAIPSLFISYVLDVEPCPMHLRLQGFLSSPGQSKDVRLPRNHGKTTQVSVGRVAWEIGNNPDIRVTVVSNNQQNAKDTVGAVKNVLESANFLNVFPDVQPDLDDWGTFSLTVKRNKVGLRDSTLKAQPIFGKAGYRSDLLIGDDLSDFDNAIRQPALRPMVKDFWVNVWEYTLEPDAREWVVGTPWHFDDVMMEREKEAARNGTLFREAVEGTDEEVLAGLGRSPWAEKFDGALLRQRFLKSRVAFSRAMRLVPTSGEETIFKEDDLKASMRPLPEKLAGSERVGAIDLAFSGDELGVPKMAGGARKKQELDRAVLGVADITTSGDCWMVHAAGMRDSYPKFKDFVVAQCQRLNVHRVVIETGNKQTTLRDDLGRELGRVGIISQGRVRSDDKAVRASRVQHVVEQHRFHLRTDTAGNLMPSMQMMFDELVQFPLGSHDDHVDVAVDLMAEAEKKIGAVEIPAVAHGSLKAADIEALNDIAEARSAAGQWASE